MLNIALESQNGAISIMDISKKEGISIDYLEQLLNKLRHKGLVNSIRGPMGGYILSRKANGITVGDIVKTLEGSISPVHCVTARKNLSKVCKMNKSCVPKIVWTKLAKAIEDCLESMTLEDLCIEARKVRV